MRVVLEDVRSKSEGVALGVVDVPAPTRKLHGLGRNETAMQHAPVAARPKMTVMKYRRDRLIA